MTTQAELLVEESEAVCMCEEPVDEVYLRRKRWDKIFAAGGDLAARYGITENDVRDAIRSVREEKKRDGK